MLKLSEFLAVTDGGGSSDGSLTESLLHVYVQLSQADGAGTGNQSITRAEK